VYNISTVAGNGAAGFQDGSGTSSQLNLPGTIFVAPSGAVYIADGANNRIRMLSGGNVSTIAGNGTAGFGGDGAAATSALLSGPRGVAVDSNGNIFVSDTGNSVIRKITSGGTISTYAGNQGFGAGYNGDNGPATNAQINQPAGLAVDASGNLYIADSANGSIRKVTASTGVITTAVGSGATATRLNNPTAVAVDASNNLYIASAGNSRIFKYSGGILSTVAGGGTAGFAGDGGNALFAQLADPQGVAVDAAGNVYIADTVNSRIRKVSNGIITTIAGTGVEGYSGDGGPATAAQLYSCDGVAIDKAGNVYVADTHNSVIRLLQPSLPTIFTGGVANAASYQAQISPGALASVFGTGFGGGPAVSPSASPTLPANVGGVSVMVNNQAAPLYYVSPGQINFQVPWETQVGTASVIVTVNGGSSNTVTVPAVSAGPGLFVSGGAAIVQNFPDYSLNGPSSPAPGGSTIIAYLTGSGPVAPATSDGALAPSSPLATSTASWGATVGTAAAKVSFIGLTPGFVGLVQANIVVPTGLAPGNYPLTVTIGGQTSNAGAISVK
jgi:uncharacterized protein (TIGR03437 family)